MIAAAVAATIGAVVAACFPTRAEIDRWRRRRSLSPARESSFTIAPTEEMTR